MRIPKIIKEHQGSKQENPDELSKYELEKPNDFNERSAANTDAALSIKDIDELYDWGYRKRQHICDLKDDGGISIAIN